MTTLKVNKNDADQTLINFIKKVFKNMPLAQIYRCFRTKKIKVNGTTMTNFKYRLQENDLIVIYQTNLVIDFKPKIIQPEPPITILYEDDNLLIVIKDHNVIVHQPYGTSLDTMVRYYLVSQQKTAEQTFVISHHYRLDKLTKGLIIYPKNKVTQQVLSQATKNQQITKKYLAICQGTLLQTQTISGYIKHDENQKKMIFYLEQQLESKSCTTIFMPLFTNNNFTLIECTLVTGRKHQIRSTLQFLNLPIIGDPKYGSTINLSNKIALFAYYLKFKTIAGPLAYLNEKAFILDKSLKAILIEQIKTEKW